MNFFIKKLSLPLIILGLIGCQNSNLTPAQKGISSASKEIEKRTPLVVVGGELNYNLKNRIQSQYKLYGIKMNPQNNTLITYGDSSQITVYNSNLEYLGGVESKNDEIKAIDISSDGKYLASAGDDGVIEIWNLDNYQLLHRMKNGSDTLAIAFSSDGKKLATGGENKVIEVWNVDVGEQIAQLEGHTDEVTQLSFIDNDRKIVSSAEDKSVKIWDVTKKRELYSYLAPSNKYGEIKDVQSFDDYSAIALTEVQRATGNRRNRNGPPVWDYTIKFKDNQGNILYEFNEHRGPITDIAIAPSRNYMASISEDKTVRLWDLEKRKHITNIVLKERGTAVSINKSGHLLALVEGKKTIKLYSIANAYAPQTSTNSTSSITASTGSSPSLYRKQHAIVIGINTYKKLSLPRLNNAVQDARSVAKTLREKGFSVIELYNDNATKDRILDALKEVKQHAIAKDSTLFYFAGHGDGVSGHNNVREGYILPYEFNSELNNPNPDVMYYDKSAISISSLIMYARDTKAKHIGIILDSCFSGLAMESKYAKKSLSTSDAKSIDQVTYDAPTRSVRIKPATLNNSSTNIYQDLLNKKSINILTAGDDQPVSDGSNHSPFTQGLLTALSSNSNQSGYIRFTTLAEYIKRYVKEKTNNKQIPQYKNDSLERGDFIFKVN
jgi:WD40 repeat protein